MDIKLIKNSLQRYQHLMCLELTLYNQSEEISNITNTQKCTLAIPSEIVQFYPGLC